MTTAHDTSPPAGVLPARIHGSLMDAAFALMVGAISLGGTLGASHRQPDRASLGALGIALILAPAAALVLRRRFPAAVLVFVKAATLTYWLFDYPRGPVFLPLIIAFINAVVRGRRLIAWIVLGAGYVSFLWLPPLATDERAPGLAAIFGLAAWLLLLGTLAEVVRVRRVRLAEARLMREEETRRRASDERLRIARELHDVLAHNISLINVQAGTALHLIDEKPEQARVALAAIKDASKETLRELRSVLGVLRQIDEESPRAPAPGLARIDELVAQASAAGLAVQARFEGERRRVPVPVDIAAFRIVQEALTNVSRHAGAATATITVTYGEHDLTVQVDDDGHGASAPDGSGAGSGIGGMRERASALGGTFDAGHRTGGGFRVRATLPLDGIA